MAIAPHCDASKQVAPAVMQGDVPTVARLVRPCTDMLWRLFPAANQSFAGALPDDRAEARAQLPGIMLSLSACRQQGHLRLRHRRCCAPSSPADDEADQWLQDTLQLRGDDLGTAAWNWTMGMAPAPGAARIG